MVSMISYMFLPAPIYLVVALDLVPVRHSQLGDAQLPLEAGLRLFPLSYPGLSRLKARLGLRHRPAPPATTLLCLAKPPSWSMPSMLYTLYSGSWFIKLPPDL